MHLARVCVWPSYTRQGEKADAFNFVIRWAENEREIPVSLSLHNTAQYCSTLASINVYLSRSQRSRVVIFCHSILLNVYPGFSLMDKHVDKSWYSCTTACILRVYIALQDDQTLIRQPAMKVICEKSRIVSSAICNSKCSMHIDGFEISTLRVDL